MGHLNYLRGLRRRWSLISACLLLGVVVGWLTTAARPPVIDPNRASVYSATAILLGSPGPETGIGSLTTLAALTKIGEVPVRVAETLDRNDPLDLAASITTISNLETRLMTISALADNANQAETVANAFAAELVRYQREQLTASGLIDSTASGIVKVIQTARAQEGRPERVTDAILSEVPRPPRLGEFVAGKGRPEELLAEAARGKLLKGGWQVPPGHPVRLTVAGGLGFLLGAALAMVLERYDTSIRDRKTAEAHFGLPVLGEIPHIRRRERKAIGTVVAAAPYSAVADAFRLLGAALHVTGNAVVGREARTEATLAVAPRIILITSPGRREGKSTVAANLASSLSETGNKVMVLSCDFRAPTLHKVIGIPPTHDLFGDIEPENVSRVLETPALVAAVGAARVSVASSETLPHRPARVLTSDRMRKVLAEARDKADFVVIDGPPITTTSDAAFLFPQVDAVLVVARAEKTAVERANVAREILERLGAPAQGVVLNGIHESKKRYAAYRPLGATGGRVSGRKGFPRLARHHKTK